MPATATQSPTMRPARAPGFRALFSVIRSVNRIKRDLSKLAYRELEFVGGRGGTRVPDVAGVLRTLEEGSWDDDDWSGRVVVVCGGSDVTNKVVVVVRDGFVTVVVSGEAEWRILGEYMRR